MPPESETRADPPQPTKNGIGRGVGSLLHASRLRCGEDLADIAQILKVRLPYLEAIEEGRFGDLPGNTYAIGFIRAYADYLGLDSGEVIRRYKEDVADANKKSDLDFPVPVPESGIPGGAVLFIGAVIAILTYGGWYASTTKSGFLAELISPIPEKISSLSPEAEKSGAEKKTSPQATEKVTEKAAEKDNPAAPQAPDEQSTVAAAVEGPETKKPPVAAAKTEPEETAVSIAPPAPELKNDTAQADKADKAKKIETVETAKTVEMPAPVVMESASAPASVASAVSAAPPALATPTPEAPAAAPPHPQQAATAPPPTPVAVVALPKPKPNPEPQKVPEKPRPEAAAVSAVATGRIVIRARTNSWIQIRDGIGNKLVVTRLLRSGDSYRVPDKPGLKLLTGNAGALEVLIDGKEAPAIGGKGAVRRSVMLDVDRLLQGTAVIE